jgi:hypothetical protein
MAFSRTRERDRSRSQRNLQPVTTAGGPRFATPGHWAAQDAGVPRRLRPSSSALREEAQDRARLDVLCRGALIARVVNTHIDGLLNVVCEVTAVGAGRQVNIIEIATAPILIDCRCGRTHELDAGRLTALAVRNEPGHPREVPLSRVAVR